MSLGMGPSSSGVAGFTMSVGSPLNHQRRQIHTIAKMGSRIGKLGGVSPKKNGAVGCMARVARIRAVVASAAPSAHQASRTIVTRDFPTGWPAGAWPRRLGVVRTRARAAHQQLEDVLETAWLTMTVALACVPSSGPTVLVLLGSSLPAQASEDCDQRWRSAPSSGAERSPAGYVTLR